MNQETIDRIRKFTDDRDWDQFHTPANLAKSISIEANELLECFQWSDENYDIEAVKEELADVLVYCRNMLDKLELDEDEIVTDFTKRAMTDQSLKGIKKLYKESPESAREKADEIIKNTYRTLLTRGMKGCYVYCLDKKLAEHLRERMKAYSQAISSALKGQKDESGNN